MQIEDLIGQTLLEISLHDQMIYLKTDKITGAIEAFGDCCSHGWIDNLISVPLPAKITKINSYGNYINVDESDPRHPKDFDVINIYRASIVTENGEITFDVWNNSNGYYGSSLELIKVRNN